MTIKEAILKSLEDLKVPVYNNEVLNHIIEKVYKFIKGKHLEQLFRHNLEIFKKCDLDKRIKKSNEFISTI
jgi:hypothetical protein